MTDIPDVKMPRLLADLQEIGRWREEQLATLREQLAGIDAEDDRLRAQRAELDRRIQENAARRQQVGAELREVPRLERRRGHDAMVAALQADRAALAERSERLQEARTAARSHLEQRLGEPEVAAAMEEFDKFREVEPVLSSLPPSYRQVVLDHHAAVKERLADVFRLAEGDAAPLDVEPLRVALVASVDPGDDDPTAFAVCVPVDFAVYREWAERDEDLLAQLSARIVATVCRTLGAVGAPDAPVAFRAYEGCLSIQVWLADHDVEAGLPESLGDILRQALAEAPELVSARVEVALAWVDSAVIAPDDGDGPPAAPEEPPAGERGASGGAGGGPSAQPAVDTSGPGTRPVQIVLKRGGSSDWW